jgi:hypothetical protein
MANYWIWNPWLASLNPPVVELLVTWQEAFYIGEGSDELTRDLVRDAGIDAAPTRWTLARCRAIYVSPDPDGDWEDRWRLVWKLRATLDRAPASLPSTPDGRVESDAVDASYQDAVHDPFNLTSARCLIVADFKDAAARDCARDAVAAAYPAAQLADGVAMGRYPQLHIDLGDRDNAYYRADAADAADVLARCRACGGATHYEETLGWSVG